MIQTDTQISCPSNVADPAADPVAAADIACNQDLPIKSTRHGASKRVALIPLPPNTPRDWKNTWGKVFNETYENEKNITEDLITAENLTFWKEQGWDLNARHPETQKSVLYFLISFVSLDTLKTFQKLGGRIEDLTWTTYSGAKKKARIRKQETYEYEENLRAKVVEKIKSLDDTVIYQNIEKGENGETTTDIDAIYPDETYVSDGIKEDDMPHDESEEIEEAADNDETSDTAKTKKKRSNEMVRIYEQPASIFLQMILRLSDSTKKKTLDERHQMLWRIRFQSWCKNGITDDKLNHIKNNRWFVPLRDWIAQLDEEELKKVETTDWYRQITARDKEIFAFNADNVKKFEWCLTPVKDGGAGVLLQKNPLIQYQLLKAAILSPKDDFLKILLQHEIDPNVEEKEQTDPQQISQTDTQANSGFMENPFLKTTLHTPLQDIIASDKWCHIFPKISLQKLKWLVNGVPNEITNDPKDTTKTLNLAHQDQAGKTIFDTLYDVLSSIRLANLENSDAQKIYYQLMIFGVAENSRKEETSAKENLEKIKEIYKLLRPKIQTITEQKPPQVLYPHKGPTPNPASEIVHTG